MTSPVLNFCLHLNFEADLRVTSALLRINPKDLPVKADHPPKTFCFVKCSGDQFALQIDLAILLTCPTLFIFVQYFFLKSSTPKTL